MINLSTMIHSNICGTPAFHGIIVQSPWSRPRAWDPNAWARHCQPSPLQQSTGLNSCWNSFIGSLVVAHLIKWCAAPYTLISNVAFRSMDILLLLITIAPCEMMSIFYTSLGATWDHETALATTPSSWFHCWLGVYHCKAIAIRETKRKLNGGGWMRTYLI